MSLICIKLYTLKYIKLIDKWSLVSISRKTQKKICHHHEMQNYFVMKETREFWIWTHRRGHAARIVNIVKNLRPIVDDELEKKYRRHMHARKL